MVHTSGGIVVSFYDADGAVALVLLDDNLVPIRSVAVRSPVAPHDAHACISLGVDRRQMIHAVFGAHASTAWHFTADAALLSCDEPQKLSGQAGSRFTYPTFLAPYSDQNLLMLFRDGTAPDADIRVKRWQPATETFSDDPEALLTGRRGKPTAGPYFNRPVRLADGRLAIFCVWRLPQDATSAGDVVNVGLDLVLTDAGVETVTSIEGVCLRRPVTPLQCPRAVAVPLGSSLMNQGSASVGPDGDPMALTYWNDPAGIPQYQLVWREGGVWNATAVSRFTTAFELRGHGTLPLPHGRPELLVRSDGTALCIFRSLESEGRLMMIVSRPPYRDEALRSSFVLVDEDLGQYEPVVDHAQFEKDGSLLLYVQACTQCGGDAACEPQGRLARLYRWSSKQVAELALLS